MYGHLTFPWNGTTKADQFHWDLKDEFLQRLLRCKLSAVFSMLHQGDLAHGEHIKERLMTPIKVPHHSQLASQ